MPLTLGPHFAGGIKHTSWAQLSTETCCFWWDGLQLVYAIHLCFFCIFFSHFFQILDSLYQEPHVFIIYIYMSMVI